MVKKLKSFWPVALLLGLIFLLYYQFLVFQKIPIPADTLVGAYFPWLDYKWGYAVGVPVKNPPISDVFSQFFPWKYQIVDLLKQGIWPLWNPLSLSGTPILATYHSAPFLPFNALLLLPKYYGWGFYIMGQTIVAALGMYLLLGRYVKDPLVKIAGALVFCLSGLMTTWLEFGTGVWSASQLPWIFLFLEGYLATKKLRYLVGVSLSFILLFLAGHAQLTMYSGGLFLAYLVYRNYKKELVTRLSFYPVIAWILAIGVSAAALLPTIAQVGLSVRGSEAYSKSFNFGLNSWYEFIRLYAADFFGNPTTYNHWDSISYHEQSSFLGVVALVFILGILLNRLKDKTVIFWSLVFAASLFMALDSPFTQWLYKQPLPFLTYSSASRTFFISSFSGAILAALSLQRFLNEPKFVYLLRRSIRLLIAPLIGALIGLFICRQILAPYLGTVDGDFGYKNVMTSIKNSLLPLMLLVLIYGLSFVNKFKKVVVLVLMLLIFFDLGRYFLKYNPFVQGNLVFPKTPIHEYLNDQTGLFRIARVDPEIMTPNTWMQYNLSSIEGYDPLALENYARLFNRVNGGSYSNSVGRYVELTNYPSKFIDALNVKYLVAIKRTAKSELFGDQLNYRVRASEYKEVFSDKSSAVLINPHATERAYFIENLTTFKSKDKMAELLDEKEFDPTKEALIVESSEKTENFAKGQLSIEKYSPNEVTLKTNSDSEGFVVLADTFDPGWQLYEDGEYKKQYEANGALRGFYTKPGEHLYTFKYWPKSFDIGLKVSAVSFMLLLAINAISIKKGVW